MRNLGPSPRIDLQTRFFPDTLERILGERLRTGWTGLKRQARNLTLPYSWSVQQALSMVRHFPDPLRKGLAGIGSVAPLPSLAVESTFDDLQEALTESALDAAVLIPFPPLTHNEQILDLCLEDDRFIPAVAVTEETPRASSKLKKYREKGAKLVRLRAGSKAENSDLRPILKAASDQGLPVMVSDLPRFSELISDFHELQFIIARMNHHDPGLAIDFAESNENVFLETSWQPAEMIGEAVRRIGAERLLFGSDWPMGGNNIHFALKKLEVCLAAGTITQEQGDLILGQNAVRVLGLEESAAPQGTE